MRSIRRWGTTEAGTWIPLTEPLRHGQAASARKLYYKSKLASTARACYSICI